MELTRRDVARWRLRSQHLTGPPHASPAAAVAHSLAVQSQDPGPATWSLGQRSGADAAAVAAGFDAGQWLRTHVLRPTWHHVRPADLRWLLALTGPRVQRTNAGQVRSAGLDAAGLARATDLLAEAVRGQHRTRPELAAVLAAAGLPASGPALVSSLMHAELAGVLVSGAVRRGLRSRADEQTYALLDERAPGPGWTPPERDAALAELARRYLASHGPAADRDLAAWAGLPLTDVRRGLAATPTEQVTCEGLVLHVTPGAEPPPAGRGDDVLLVQVYDEAVLHSATKHLVGDGLTERPELLGVVLAGAQVAGRWRRTATADGLTVEVAPARPPGRERTRALAREVDRVGAFWGLPARLVLRGP